MRSILIIAISLAIAGAAMGQTKAQFDSLYTAKKNYKQTKKNCIYLDTATTAAKKVRQDQLTIIDKLKAIKERQTAVQTTQAPQ